MTAKAEPKTTEPTLADVITAVSGVGQKVDHLAARVDAIDKRVTAIETAPPQLKTRVVQSQPAAPSPSVERRPAPAANKVTVDQAGGDAEKYFSPMLCTKVALSKDRKREVWRIDLFLQGLRRPASLMEWQFDSRQEMIEFVQIGWPEFCADYLDEDRFIELDAEYQRLKDDKIKPPRIIYDDGISFMVESMKTRRDMHGKTYINAVAIYPFADQTN